MSSADLYSVKIAPTLPMLLTPRSPTELPTMPQTPRLAETDETVKCTDEDPSFKSNPSTENIYSERASAVIVNDPPSLSASRSTSFSRRASVLSLKLRQTRIGRRATLENRYLCKKSCYYFDIHNPLRKIMIAVCRSPYFDVVIVGLILVNAVILAIQDYRGGKNAWELRLMNSTENAFLIAFIIEMLVKIIAMGFILDKYSYLRDGWNWLDFVVVIAGVLALFMTETSQAGFLRTFRILRPLRSLAAFPGMRILVKSMLSAFPRMGNVVVLAIFLLSLFAVLGLTIWGGTMGRRCRLIEAPVTFMPIGQVEFCGRSGGLCVTDNLSALAVCQLDVLCAAAFARGEAYTIPNGSMFGGRDVVFTPRVEDCAKEHVSGIAPICVIGQASLAKHCVAQCREAYVAGELFSRWPIDTEQPVLCGGRHQCAAGTTCGSCLLDDASFGPNSDGIRFSLRIEKSCGDWGEDVNIPELNYGITHFNNFGGAFLTVFQSVTLEGWVDIMYMLQDGSSEAFPVIYFFAIIFIGNFFLINISLAIILDSFNTVSAEMEEGLPPSGAKLQERYSYVHAELPGFSKRVLRRLAQAIFYSELFQLFVMFAIVANVTTLMLDKYPPHTGWMADFLDVTNLTFYVVFVVEMFITVVALGPVAYCTNYASAFDGVIVGVSTIEVLFADGSSAMSALRAFRLLRVFKLAKKWVSFRVLLKSIVGTLLQMGNFMFLLFLMIMVFALMGQTFFANFFHFDEFGHPLVACSGGICRNDTAYGEIRECNNFEQCVEKCPAPDFDCVPRAHFDTFFAAFLTVFQIVTGENWNTVMYDGMKAAGWPFAIYFIFVFISLQCAILNLFLAVLMSNFEKHSSALRENEREHEREREHITVSLGNLNKFRSAVMLVLKNQALDRASDEGRDASEPKVSFQVDPPASSSTTPPLSAKDKEKDKEPVENDILIRKLRKCALAIVIYPVFDQCVMLTIVLSSGILAYQTPLDEPDTPLARWFYYANLVFSIIFTVEMVLKMIAFGVFRRAHADRDAYMRVGWNVLDFVIVGVGWLDILGPSNLESLKTLRILRAFRPLRLISRLQTLKLVVDTLFQAIPQLFNLFIVGVLFFLIFGLGGLSYFKGGFHSCWDANLQNQLNYRDFKNSLSIDGSLYNGTDLQPMPNPLCYDTNPSLAAYKFLDVHSSCSTSDYRRDSSATPLCVVHCEEAVQHEFCDQVHPWGYRIMRCSDCQQTFCPNPSEDDHAACAVVCADARTKAHKCYDNPSPECMVECIAECLCPACDGLMYDAASCVEQGGKWVNFNQNFDNIANAMSSLLEISTTEMWVDTMYAGADFRGPYMHPHRNSSKYASLFFVLFILVGCFFVLNLCVGVIIDNFNAMKKSSNLNSLFMTQAQQKWVESQKELSAYSFYLKSLTKLKLNEQSQWRRDLFCFVQCSAFDNAIMICILLNSVSMALQIHPSPSDVYSNMLRAGNFIFAGVFNLEAITKLVALRWVYFAHRWNCFDILCVCATDVGIVLELVTTANLGSVMSIFRLLRIARLFRLVKFMKGLNQLFFAFVLSVPKLCNVAGVLCLLVVLYAILGVNLFAKVRYSGMHGVHANFHSFPKAVVTLLRSMTGEGWNELMYSLGRDQWYFESLEGVVCEIHMDVATKFETYQLNEQLLFPIQCGSRLPAVIYFISFTTIVTFIILNLFIAVIFEGFDDSQKGNSHSLTTRCIEIWKKYDPMFSMQLPLPQVFAFIDEVMDIGEPCQVNAENIDLRRARIWQLVIDPVDNTVPFYSAVCACLRHDAIGQNDRAIADLDDLDRRKPNLKLQSNVSSSGKLSLEETVAARKIQYAFKERQSLRASLREAERLREEECERKKLEDERNDPRAAG